MLIQVVVRRYGHWIGPAARVPPVRGAGGTVVAGGISKLFNSTRFLRAHMDMDTYGDGDTKLYLDTRASVFSSLNTCSSFYKDTSVLDIWILAIKY